MTKKSGKITLKKIVKSALRKIINAPFGKPYLPNDPPIAELLKLRKHAYFLKRKNGLLGLLELHASHACNLACESCSHYSNHNFKGSITLRQADEWMSLWNKKIAPGKINLLGGEPTINPQLSDIIRLTRKKWKYAEIVLITNGFFLHRHPDLPKVLAEIGNARVEMSIHHSSDMYMEKIAPNLALAKTWEKEYGLEIKILQSDEYWTRRYKGYGKTLQPFEDNNPRASWEGCRAKYCKQLLEGKLWKCPPLAYLPMLNEKFKLSEKWQPYLQYKPLSSDCTGDELIAFIKEKEIPECAMCPVELEHFELPNPLVRPVN